MDVDLNTIRNQLNALSHKPSDLEIETEATHIHSLVTDGELKTRLGEYGDPRLEGIGGSGIVLSAVFAPHGTRRAIKFPRQRIYAGGSDVAVAEDPEIEALSKLSHQNITRLYEAFKLNNGRGSCIITEYVEEPRSLDQFAKRLCCGDDCRKSELRLASAVRELAEVIARVVDALCYMHEHAGLLHFDIKPDNVLVSKSGHPFVTDLGFARDLRKAKALSPEDRIDIGFTWKYAHPLLTNPDEGARVTRTAAKAKNSLKAGDISPIFDVFAFGRTLQEVLCVLEQEYADNVHSYYAFNYLHVVACLCLDGRNAANGKHNPNRSFVIDTTLGMPTAVFRAQKLSSFSEIKTALERLLGRRRLEDEVPELDPWAAASINVSDLGITTLTPRVRTLLEHPAVERLANETQLGLVSTIFPTATHSRLQHSLGVFHAVREYITALYYDPENPTFRVFFSAEAARRALLAAVIHDLGQTSFGHELEEADATTFDHASLAHDVAESDAFTDGHGRTLKTLVEDSGDEGWAVRLEDVLNLLRSAPQTPFDAVLHDILDSPLDADKLDYLLRDSVEARVQYGRGIDHQRFLRSLTTAASRTGDAQRLRLAIKQKGAASAEAFALARYQLYQSVYWHHTFRAAKAMLLTVAGEAVRSLSSGTPPGAQAPLLNPNTSSSARLRAAYLESVFGITAPSSKGEPTAKNELTTRATRRRREAVLVDELGARLTATDGPNSAKALAQDRTIRFLWKLTTGRARTLLDDLIARRYYKRIYELPLSALPDDGWAELRQIFVGTRRLDFRQRTESALQNALISEIQGLMQNRESLISDHSLERIGQISNERYLFLVDLPTRGWMSGGEDPIFVSDYKRRHFRSGLSDAGAPDTLWASQMGPMMRRIAMFRVFCEPEVHRILTRVLAYQDVERTIKEVLRDFRVRVGN